MRRPVGCRTAREGMAGDQQAVCGRSTLSLRESRAPVTSPRIARRLQRAQGQTESGSIRAIRWQCSKRTCKTDPMEELSRENSDGKESGGGLRGKHRTNYTWAGWRWIALLIFLAMIGCDVNAALEQVSQARHLSADLLVQFTKAADAANRAVMADTDEASLAFAREAGQAKEKVQVDIDSLKPLLDGLHYSDEGRLLQEFVNRFREYCELDRRILDLAVENTNLKAQRLSFGPAQEAADSFRDSLKPVTPRVPADKWRVEALVATAVATVREIQVLQAPHIADADEAVMTRMEKSMATSEAAARNALTTLSSLVEPRSQPNIVAAKAALDRFMAVNQQIISLSRRNTNVRSLALSLNEKGKLIPRCEEVLHALRDALAKRGAAGTR